MEKFMQVMDCKKLAWVVTHVQLLFACFLTHHQSIINGTALNSDCPLKNQNFLPCTHTHPTSPHPRHEARLSHLGQQVRGCCHWLFWLTASAKTALHLAFPLQSHPFCRWATPTKSPQQMFQLVIWNSKPQKVGNWNSKLVPPVPIPCWHVYMPHTHTNTHTELTAAWWGLW